MTRTERLLRLARQRGDLLAVAVLESGSCDHCAEPGEFVYGAHRLCAGHWNALRQPFRAWTEAELREAWGR